MRKLRPKEERHATNEMQRTCFVRDDQPDASESVHLCRPIGQLSVKPVHCNFVGELNYPAFPDSAPKIPKPSEKSEVVQEIWLRLENERLPES